MVNSVRAAVCNGGARVAGELSKLSSGNMRYSAHKKVTAPGAMAQGAVVLVLLI